MASQRSSGSVSVTSCKKCKKLYDDPRMLPCLHSFCKRCIGKSIVQTGSKKTIRCPTCYNTTPLPLKGVEEYPRNVRLNYETMIAKYETQILSNPPPSCDECDQDPALETVSFCYTCPGFLCKDCHAQHIRSKNLTKNHKVLVLQEARKRKSIKKDLKQNIPQPPIMCPQHPDKSVEFFCTGCNILICIQCALIQHCGHELEELSKLAQRKKDEISKGIQSIAKSINKLEEGIAMGENTKKKIESSKKAVDAQIQKVFEEMREALNKREKALLAECNEIATTKQTSLSIQVDELTSLRDQIVACSVTVSEAQESYSDAELLSVVTTFQSRVEELSQQFSKTSLKLKEDDSLSCDINSRELDSEILKFGSMKKQQPRDYKTLNQPVMTIPSNSPGFSAVHGNGDIFVTDYNGHFIHVYNKSGNKMRSIGSHGTGKGQFTHPSGIAVVGDVLFVTEYSGHRVQKLTTGGEFLSMFGSSGSQNRQFNGALGCTVSVDGKIYVSDQDSHHIQVFNPDGTFSHIIGQGHVQSPRVVALDSLGQVHVASLNVKPIKVFSPNGDYIREYGGDILQAPSGVAVDDDGYCLVGDWHGCALHVFDPQGKLVHSIKYTSYVCGVTLDKEGFVYVVEYGSNKVYKY